MIVYNIQRHSAYGQRATACHRLTTFTFRDMKMADSNYTRFTTVYALSDPETGEVRYVGKTVLSLEKRLKGHFSDKAENHKTHWIRSLLARGLKPTIKSIEEDIAENWAERERYWIAYYRDQGARLVNLADGGQGSPGWSASEEQRAKLSAAMKGRRFSMDHRANLSASLKGRKFSAEECAKISAALKGRTPSNKGKTHSPETRARISASLKGKSASPETRAKMGAAQKGRVHSPETRAKIGLGNRGKVISIESRAKIAVAARNRQLSQETRAKIAAAGRNRYCSPETRAKLSAAARSCSPETRAKLSAARKGKPSPNKGKSPSADTCARMSAAQSAAHKRRRYGTSQDQMELAI